MSSTTAESPSKYQEMVEWASRITKLRDDFNRKGFDLLEGDAYWNDKKSVPWVAEENSTAVIRLRAKPSIVLTDENNFLNSYVEGNSSYSAAQLVMMCMNRILTRKVAL